MDDGRFVQSRRIDRPQLRILIVLSPPVLAGECGPAAALPHLPPAAAAVARLDRRCCRWPLGEPADEGFAFCGAPRLARSSYCAAHARLAGPRGAWTGGRA